MWTPFRTWLGGREGTVARRQDQIRGEWVGAGEASTHLEVGKKGVRGKGVAGERGGRSGVGFRRSDKELGVLAREAGAPSSCLRGGK